MDGTTTDRDRWESRYRDHPALWSGLPNPVLEAETATLVPGTALEVGCGEGGDALWLASRGWRVTGLDFSATALERAAARGQELGLAEQPVWRCADPLHDGPPPGRFDLVTAFFVHLPPPERAALHAWLAGATAPGGTLLVVGHHPDDLAAGVQRPAPERLFTAEQVSADLDPGAWETVTAEARPRTVPGPDGGGTTLHDSVLRARRRR